MLTAERIAQFYRDVDSLRLKFPVAEISRVTGQSKGNVSRYLNHTLPPSQAFLNKFYEVFSESIKKVSRGSMVEEPAPTYGDMQAKYIASLERENARLQKDLDLSLGESRHSLLLIRAMMETTQDLLVELLAKQRKKSLEEIAAEVGIKNGEKYLKLKEEGNFAYVGK